MPEALISGAAPAIVDPVTVLFGVACILFSWPVVGFFYAIYRLIKERLEIRRYIRG